MKILVTCRADELQAGDKVLGNDMLEALVIQEVFNTGHARTQVTLDDKTVWFESDTTVCVVKEIS